MFSFIGIKHVINKKIVQEYMCYMLGMVFYENLLYMDCYIQRG